MNVQLLLNMSTVRKHRQKNGLHTSELNSLHDFPSIPLYISINLLYDMYPQFFLIS